MTTLFSIHRALTAVSAALLVCSAALAAPKVYVGNFKDDTVSVVDTAGNAVMAVIPVAKGPHGMAMSGDGRTLYVSGDGSSKVSVIDTSNDRVVRSIEVGKTPHGLALSADGRRLLVGLYGEDRVAVIDTSSGTEEASITVAKPHTIAWLPGTQRIYVASQAPGHFAVVVIDLATASVVRELPLDKPPRDLEFAFDGRALYYTVAGENAVHVLDPHSDQVVADIPTGVSPHIASLFRGVGVGTVVVQGPGELTLFDPATNTVLRSLPVGRQPHWAAASTDGKTVFVTDEGSNELSIVDLASSRTRNVAVGNAPRKVAVQPTDVPAPSAVSVGGARVSIANFAFAPAELVIEPGETVTWTNDDGAPHGLTHRDGAPGAELPLPGASVSRRYDAPGRYDYVCSVHPYMSATVTVRALRLQAVPPPPRNVGGREE
ncbi:MAG: cytochrome D1 domain-containing protein [Burkholderiales bacterium]